ncbi:DUF1080 domain-containing protein [Acidobacteria bacterium AH-259-A15]|nr:DUF1080 domain-containing protein [Acidobacteria bacterium AH-259-A15]
MTQQLFRVFGLMWVVTMFLTFQTNAASEPDPLMGNWEGTYINNRGVGGTIQLQVISLGGGNYLAALRIDDGPRLEVPGNIEGDKGVFEGKVDQGPDAGGPADVRISQYSDSRLIGTIRDVRRSKGIDVTKVEKKPPTLGAKPPAGATVLFDGSSLDQWQSVDRTPAQWKIVDHGAMEVTDKNIVTKQEFGDVKIHLEFRTPFMPEATGQQRGNSGVYVQGRYEVQVLDSFGLEGKDNECGGIYQVAAPKVNAALPPLQWQTYDITFRAPQFDGSGNKTKNAVISVEHNGIKVHDQLEVPGITRGGVGEDEVPRGGIMLQDHGNPVQYRNIWVMPL